MEKRIKSIIFWTTLSIGVLFSSCGGNKSIDNLVAGELQSPQTRSTQAEYNTNNRSNSYNLERPYAILNKKIKVMRNNENTETYKN